MVTKMDYKESTEYVLSIPLFADKLGTDCLNQILDCLGHPERSYPVIHIAGTNGKGSTCAFLSSMLQAAGYRVGMFTSPHLIKINERMQIDEKTITDDEWTEVFEEVMHAVEEAKKDGIAHPSFFEFVFLMAAVYFQKQQVDYAIFETGMGGRLDATNIVQPILTIITSVGMDHMQYLGDTLEKIAFEKAGIMKKDVPALFFNRKDTATQVIVQQAKVVGAPLRLVEKSQYKISKISEKTIDFSLDSGYYRYCELQICKTALYQVENAVLAIEAYEQLLRQKNRVADMDSENESVCRLIDKHIDEIQTGLIRMVWNGRMQCIGSHIYVDGAHNEEAIEAFCHTLEVMFPKEHKILLFAVSKDKDYKTMIRRLSEITFDEIIIVRYEGSRSAEIETVRRTFGQFSKSKITSFDDIRDGFEYAKNHVRNQYLFCVGSLYLVGNLLSLGV